MLFCKELLCFNTMPCRHMPLLVHLRKDQGSVLPPRSGYPRTGATGHDKDFFILGSRSFGGLRLEAESHRWAARSANVKGPPPGKVASKDLGTPNPPTNITPTNIA